MNFFRAGAILRAESLAEWSLASSITSGDFPALLARLGSASKRQLIHRGSMLKLFILGMKKSLSQYL